MAAPAAEPQAPPTLLELKAMELSRWLQHKHDGTSTCIKKDLVDAGLRENVASRTFIWTDGTTFPNTRGLVSHILATTPDKITELHASSISMQKVLKAGLSRQPQTAAKPKRPADPNAPRKSRKKVSLGAPSVQAPASFHAIPGVPHIQAPEPPAPQENHNPGGEPPVSLAEQLAEKLLSGEYKSERQATKQAIALLLEGMESPACELNIVALKQLLQQHRVQGELHCKGSLLVEDYDRALEAGAARTLSDLQTAATDSAEPPRSDEDLRQDIEALSDLLASNHKFTSAYLGTLERQKAALEEELAARGEHVKAEAEFKLQRTGLIEEVGELLKAEDRNLVEAMKAAAGLRKLFEYL